MKTYRIEPTYKKSVVEYDTFRKRVEGDKSDLWIRKEIGWRWGEFDVFVPETEEEVIEWANDQVGDAEYYKSLAEVLDEYGEEDLEGMIGHAMPDTSEACAFHELSDYQYEMNSTWDGCWEDWDIFVGGDDLSEEEQEELLEEVQEKYSEDYEDGVAELGFEHMDNYTDIHCAITAVEIDEDRNAIDINS